MDAEGFQSATGATDAEVADLEAYRLLLAEWSGRMNLVGPSALAEFWQRHALDSWQLLALEPFAKRWADLGTGAGLPGVVLAIGLKARDGAHVHLVDSLTKRCRFLADVVSRLALPAEVHNARAETLSRAVDIVTARACAPMGKLLGYSQPWLKSGVTGLFLKGEGAAVELDAARETWRFSAEMLPSRSHETGRIVRVRELAAR